VISQCRKSVAPINASTGALDRHRAHGLSRGLAIFTLLASILSAWLYPKAAMFDYEKHIH
jgi:hypothetical protein